FTGNVSHVIVGGLWVVGGVVLIAETTFEHNGADGAGAMLVGDFFDFPLRQNRTVIISDSAFVQNGSVGPPGGGNGQGAALLNQEGTVQVTNTTFARNGLNSFLREAGIAIAIANFGTLSLTNSTLAENFSFPLQFGQRVAVILGGTNARTFLQNTIATHNAAD